MRGQPPGRVLGLRHDRIIPARAGPTRPGTRPASRWSDHPRSCGANHSPVERCSAMSGSSPLVRGQPTRANGSTRTPRIIPARAGPTPASRWSWRKPADHPRSCGANLRLTGNRSTLDGSSPLVRGQLHETYVILAETRIIPARAGPTPLMRPASMRSTDHPRSCGANLVVASPLLLVGGSSPLVRGQRRIQRHRRHPDRIIPARAGPTYRLLCMKSFPTDHPRSCGANTKTIVPPDYVTGSSPLVRGQPPTTGSVKAGDRIIPARAGPTDNRRTSSRDITDHPRSCGANSLILRGKSGLSQIKIFDYSSGIWQ